MKQVTLSGGNGCSRVCANRMMACRFANVNPPVLINKGELTHKNKLLLKNSLVFEKFNGTLVASQRDCVKEKIAF